MNSYVQQLNAFNLQLADNDPARLDYIERMAIGEYYAYISALRQTKNR